jgi:hypothetical protein
MKDDRGDLFAESHSILARWRNYFSQILNLHGVNYVRQTEIHTAEPLAPEPRVSEVELDIENLKSHKAQGLIKYQQNLLKQGVRKFAVRFINRLFLFGIRRNCLRSGRSRS